MEEQTEKKSNGDNVMPDPPRGKNFEEIIGKNPDLAREIDSLLSPSKIKAKKKRTITREQQILSFFKRLEKETNLSYCDISFTSDVRLILEEFLRARTPSPRQFRNKDTRREFSWDMVMIGMAMERMIERERCSCFSCGINCPNQGEKIK